MIAVLIRFSLPVLYSRISLVLFKTQGLNPKLGAVTADLNTSERLLTHLTALVDCKALHNNYLNATRGLCEGGLLGLVLMLIASFTAAILLTVMVWVDSHTWIYIRKRTDYSQVDEPSYASHQQQTNMHHNHNSQTISRTLPRNHHNGYCSILSHFRIACAMCCVMSEATTNTCNFLFSIKFAGFTGHPLLVDRIRCNIRRVTNNTKWWWRHSINSIIRICANWAHTHWAVCHRITRVHSTTEALVAITNTVSTHNDTTAQIRWRGRG